MKLNIPFYRQSTSFTCDPACLMMVLKYFYPEIEFSQKLELDIWREAYGIGILGCMPQGLANSAALRGLQSVLVCKKEGLIQISEKLAKGENRKIALFTSKLLLEISIARGMKVVDKDPSMKDIEEALICRKIPLVMINMYFLYGEDSPHWVVVSGYDGEYFFINDPYNEDGKDFRIKKIQFLQMMGDLKKRSRIEGRMLLVYISTNYENQ